MYLGLFKWAQVNDVIVCGNDDILHFVCIFVHRVYIDDARKIEKIKRIKKESTTKMLLVRVRMRVMCV